MLRSLTIKNFILIDEIDLDFTSGLTVFSGETGAGKSIILDALEIILGERASPQYLKNEDTPCILCAEFDISHLTNIGVYLEKIGYNNDNYLIIKRVIFKDGKTKSYINDSLVSLNTIKEFAPHIIEISTQHDSRGLFDTSNHIEILDEYAQIEDDKKMLLSSFFAWQELNEEVKKIEQLKSAAEDEKSYLQHVVEELRELDIKEGEEDLLSVQRLEGRDSSKIKQISENITAQLENSTTDIGIIDRLHQILKHINRGGIQFQTIEPFFNRAMIEIGEGYSALNELTNKLDNSHHSLEEIEDRLFKIKGVARKYNITSNQLHNFLEQCQQKLYVIDNYDQVHQEAEKKLKLAKELYLKHAKSVSELRKKAALRLKSSVQHELQDLKMRDAQLEILFIDLEESAWNRSGIEKVVFHARTNNAGKFDIINKVASGGELSRFYLALKVGLNKVKLSPTLIFDEVDTGVGGAVATSIGQKLATLAASSQIFVITHQPQVAVYSDQHFLVSKIINQSNTSIKVDCLTLEDKIQEIARMLSGEVISGESYAAAKALIQQAA